MSLDNLAQQLALVDSTVVKDEDAMVTRIGIHMRELRAPWVVIICSREDRV